MSASVYVLDASFKRTQIKVTPGKYLREILEEACRAKKLNPEEYTLKNQNNKPLDLSQPFRLSGLSAGAKLQLTQASRSPSVVSVALQLPESEGGGRLSNKFASSTSLWQVLRKYEEGVAGEAKQKRNLTQRALPEGSSGAGRLVYEQPVINVMGRNLETFADLQKTLAQLGFNSGNVMMRLTFKSSGQPLEEAMVEITQYFKAVDTVPAGIGSSAMQEARGAHANGTLASVPDADADTTEMAVDGQAAGQEPNEDVEMVSALPAQTAAGDGDDIIASSSETQPQPEKEPPSNTINGISVYRPPSSSTPAAAREPDDPTVFEPSIAHAKAHQAALERQSRNTRLKSDKQLEEEEAARQAQLSTVQNVTVRVRYPDQSIIETTIYASESGSDLHTKARGTLEHDSEPFELRYSGHKGSSTVPDSASKRLVKDLGFRGKVLVTLVWADNASVKARQGPSLKQEYRSRAQDLKVELQQQQAESEAAPAPVVKKDEAAQGKGKGRGNLEGKLKKFMGFGKK